MEAIVGRHRTGKVRTRTLTIPAQKGVQTEINVTPLVDIVLVLLIIFMVTTPLVEKDLAISLSAEKHTENAAEIVHEQVIVALDATGAAKVNGQPVSPAGYVEAVRQKLEGRAPEDRVVFVVAEDKAPYRALVEAVDGAKKGGAETVGLPTETSY